VPTSRAGSFTHSRAARECIWYHRGMKILIDIGNSQTKWAVGETPAAIALCRVTATSRRAAPALAALRALARYGKPSALVIGSVVPAVTAVVRAAARSLYPRTKIVVPRYRDFARRMPLAVVPRIEPGVDRLANALALHMLHKAPACALDVGTAMTLEVVDRRGAFVGGAILPGVALQYAALAKGTAQVRVARGSDGGMEGWMDGRKGSSKISQSPTQKYRILNKECRSAMPGRDTAGALAFGIQRGVQWALAGLVRDVVQALGEPLRSVVVTGGGAEQLCAFLRAQGLAATADGLLTLRGLMLIAEKL